MITQASLKDLLRYDPETGLFVWLRKPSKRVRVGALACSASTDGKYVKVTIGRVDYRAHRLAWFYMTGEWPTEQIDHLNCLGTDNRFINLRPASARLNQQNRRKPQKTNKLGVLGVSRHGPSFRAQLKVNGKTCWRETFETLDLARLAYIEAKRKFHQGCTI